jgi:hypothetical protein
MRSWGHSPGDGVLVAPGENRGHTHRRQMSRRHITSSAKIGSTRRLERATSRSVGAFPGFWPSYDEPARDAIGAVVGAGL